MVRKEQIGLALLAFFFAIAGLVGLFLPHLLFEPIGIELSTVAGVAEIRAAYAGLLGAGAYLFAMGARHVHLRDIALVFAVIVLGGFTLGRLLSLLLDGFPDHPIAMIALVVEGIGCAIAFFLLRIHRQSK